MNTEDNEDNKVNLEGTDRGEETIEQLEARLPQAAVDLANENAEKIVLRKKKEKRQFEGKRNRGAWNRMNNPVRLKKIEANLQRMYNLIEGKGWVTDAELKAQEDAGNVVG